MTSNLRNALQAFDLNHFTPYAIGFDRHIDRLWDYASHQTESTGYPPYNIEKKDEFNYVIEMALAGFSKKDIEIEVAEGCLSVKSVKEKEEKDTIYKGISQRNFNRKFTLADDIVVNGANLENGMLSIELERIIPEEKKPRKIEVK